MVRRKVLHAVLVTTIAGPIGVMGPAGTVHALAEGRTARGEEIARNHCRRCHRLSDADRFGGLDNVPSFPLLVEKRPDWRERFATFHARRPHPAFVTIRGVTQREAHLPPTVAVIEITLEEVDDLVAFAATLEPAPK